MRGDAPPISSRCGGYEPIVLFQSCLDGKVDSRGGVHLPCPHTAPRYDQHHAPDLGEGVGGQWII